VRERERAREREREIERESEREKARARERERERGREKLKHRLYAPWDNELGQIFVARLVFGFLLVESGSHEL
jgi:hypothetical protein